MRKQHVISLLLVLLLVTAETWAAGTGKLQIHFVDVGQNDLSIASVIEFTGFRAEIGGNLSGRNTGSYKDRETSVAR